MDKLFIRKVESVELTYRKECKGYELYCKKGDSYIIWNHPLGCLIFPPYPTKKVAEENVYREVDNIFTTKYDIIYENENNNDYFGYTFENFKVFYKAKVVLNFSDGSRQTKLFNTNQAALEYAQNYIDKYNLKEFVF